MLNQERECTSTVIAHTTIAFIASTYDLLKTQIWYFIKVAVTLLFLYDDMPASALDKMKSPTSIKPEANLGERINLRTSGQPEVPYAQHEKEEHISYFQPDETSIEFSTQIDEDCRIDQALCAGQDRTSRIRSCVTIKIQRFMLNKMATWNDMKFQRSTIVCNAKNASDTRDQAKPFAFVVVCYMALLKRLRSRQSNTCCRKRAQGGLML